MEKIIEVKNLYKSYKIHEKIEGHIFKRKVKEINAVNGVSFSINQGEVVGIVGLNGAGKSTLIKMLTGVVEKTKGDLSVFSKEPYKNRLENNKYISAVFGQRTQLNWDLPAIDSFKLLKAVYNIDDKIYEKNINNFKGVFGIEDLLNQPVRTLSLGQKMKCELAAAFLHNPKIVFLDEPTIGLDLFTKDNVREFLTDMNQRFGTTIIITSHDLVDIESTCNRAIILKKGEILSDCTMSELKIGYKTNITIETYNLNPIIDNLENINNQYNIIVSEHKIIINEVIDEDVSKIIQSLCAYNEVKKIDFNKTCLEDIIKDIHYRNEAKNG